jgi:hypothetical protein
MPYPPARKGTDRHRALRRGQCGLQVEPVDLGHVQVGDDATRLLAAALVEEGLRRRIGLDAKSAGTKEPRQGQQEGGIVVDDVNGGFDHGGPPKYARDGRRSDAGGAAG